MIYTLICRSIIIYTFILLLIRLMGKRQLGEMQPFELVITLTIADLATIPMGESTIPLIQGIVPAITLVCVHFLICLLSRKNLFFRKVFNGKPIILLDSNGINYENLKNVNMNFNDLLEGLHSQGYFNLEELLYVILQTNGSLTILTRAAYSPLTSHDLKIEKEANSLPIILIEMGKINEENLKLAKIDKEFLFKNLKKLNILTFEHIVILTLNNQGKIYVQEENQEFKILECNYKGGEW